MATVDLDRPWTPPRASIQTLSGEPPSPGSHPHPHLHPPLDLSPVSAYEIVTRQMVEATQRDVTEIKARINNLMVMVAGALVVNIVLRLAGFA